MFGLFGKCQFVFVDVAERDDARQQHGVGFQLVEKNLPRHAFGTACRQIQRRARQPLGLRAGLKTIDQPAIDQRGNDGAQERHGEGNTENAHRLP